MACNHMQRCRVASSRAGARTWATLAVAAAFAGSALVLAGCGKKEEGVIGTTETAGDTHAQALSLPPTGIDEPAHNRRLAVSAGSSSPIIAGDSICLLVPSTGRYLDVQGEFVQARFQDQGTWQEFTIEMSSEGVVHSGDVVYLRAHNGMYVEVEGVSVLAGSSFHHYAGELTIEKKSGSGAIWAGDEIFLRVHSAKYISVQSIAVEAWPRIASGSTFIVEKFGFHEPRGSAPAPIPAGAATPTPINAGEIVYFLAHTTGKYLDVQEQSVQARYPEQGVWQGFIIEMPSGGPVRSGDMVYLRAHNGKYIQVEDSLVRASYKIHHDVGAVTIERVLGNGTIRTGDEVFLRARTGQYIGVESTAVQTQSRTVSGCAFFIEKFGLHESSGPQAIPADPRIVAGAPALPDPAITGSISSPITVGESIYFLVPSTGKYIDVQEEYVRARYKEQGVWQGFIVEMPSVGRVRSGDVVYLRAHTGKYLEVEGSSVQAVSSVHRDAGAVTVVKNSGDGTIWAGDKVFLRARNGKYISVQSEVVQARSGDAAGCDGCAFVIEKFGFHDSSGPQESNTITTTKAPPIVTNPYGNWEAPKFRRHEPVRHCYLAVPLKEGFGCYMMASLSGPEFGLNIWGQETTGKRKCLERLRLAGGDSFVYEVGACELWACHSRGALRGSAAPDGDAPVLPQITLRAENGNYVVEGQDLKLRAIGDLGDATAKFRLVRNEDSTISLQDSVGHFASALQNGSMIVDRDRKDLWEKFSLVQNTDGTVSLRSYHGRFVTVTGESVHARGEWISAEQKFWLAEHAGDPHAVSKMSASADIYSQHCQYEESTGGKEGQSIRAPVYVKLWEWNFPDVARECEEYLAPNGFDAVQISPVTEHVLGTQWWTKYQPVSFGLNSRSGTFEELRDMVARCRDAGVQVAVDLVINHVGSPCQEAREDSSNTPCQAWNGSMYGNRRIGGARGWDSATPEEFHHRDYDDLLNCGVSAPSYLCGSPTIRDCSCCTCDMYGLPDWDTGLQQVREKHYRHIEELFDIGVTMLRLDAALYTATEDLATVLNLLPWDYIYQEWWGEYPIPERTQYVGHMRDVGLTWKITNALTSGPGLDGLLSLDFGTFGIRAEDAIYPLAYHDGRTNDANSARATYKNGLEYHQAQKFLLAWPKSVRVLLWGGYSWADTKQGPPGCELGGDQRCVPHSVYDKAGVAACLPTPTESPLPVEQIYSHRWVCEHRWEGVAGLIEFRKTCRGQPVARADAAGDEKGHLAFQIGDDCFVALVRGHNNAKQSSWGALGNWSLAGVQTGLPEGRYCDMASLATRKGWDRQSCPREVEVDSGGQVLNGMALQGDLLAIYTGARLPDRPSRRLRTPTL